MPFGPVSHSPDCSCCWIIGYGVYEDRPGEWGERMFSHDPECVEHVWPESQDNLVAVDS